MSDAPSHDHPEKSNETLRRVFDKVPLMVSYPRPPQVRVYFPASASRDAALDFVANSYSVAPAVFHPIPCPVAEHKDAVYYAFHLPIYAPNGEDGVQVTPEVRTLRQLAQEGKIHHLDYTEKPQLDADEEIQWLRSHFTQREEKRRLIGAPFEKAVLVATVTDENKVTVVFEKGAEAEMRRAAEAFCTAHGIEQPCDMIDIHGHPAFSMPRQLLNAPGEAKADTPEYTLLMERVARHEVQHVQGTRLGAENALRLAARALRAPARMHNFTSSVLESLYQAAERGLKETNDRGWN